MAIGYTVKLVYSHSQKDQKLFFKTNYRIIQVKSIAECSTSQCFQPLLSYQLLLRSLFCLFLSGHFTHVLLYWTFTMHFLFMGSLTIGKFLHQFPIYLYHSHFDQVRCGPLYCCVDSLSLCLGPGMRIGSCYRLQVTFPSKHGLNVALLSTCVHGLS